MMLMLISLERGRSETCSRFDESFFSRIQDRIQDNRTRKVSRM